jgi:hypothetical protein
MHPSHNCLPLLPVSSLPGDCSTSRKACKNCSCGRAEKEEAGERVQLTQEMLDNPQSSCGSVSAFRAFTLLFDVIVQ